MLNHSQDHDSPKMSHYLQLNLRLVADSKHDSLSLTPLISWTDQTRNLEVWTHRPALSTTRNMKRTSYFSVSNLCFFCRFFGSYPCFFCRFFGSLICFYSSQNFKKSYPYDSFGNLSSSSYHCISRIDYQNQEIFYSSSFVP